MRQFIAGSDQDYQVLENQVREKCIRFKNQEMPPGSVPPRAHIGFELDSMNGRTRLLVEYGVRYSGRNEEVRCWLRDGQKDFESFGKMIKWIRSKLATAYSNTGDDRGSVYKNSGLGNTAGSLTNLHEVESALGANANPVYINESDIFRALRRHVKGQDLALETLSGVVARQLVKTAPKRPAVLFSVGPTGVGKTRTAEVLPIVLDELWDSTNRGYAFVRLDMSEYQEAFRVSQLLGAPQGYVGHGEESQLLSALRQNPRTIVLFDEIEKSHPDILKAIMNAMDAGRLSSASSSGGGYEVDCRKAIFILTSNLQATNIIQETAGIEHHNHQVDEICRHHLNGTGIPAEIVGRIGKFLVYRPLDTMNKAEILTLTAKELAKEFGIDLVRITPEVVVNLYRKVEGDSFGVRPIRTMLDEELGPIFIQAANEQAGRICISGIPYGYISIERTK